MEKVLRFITGIILITILYSCREAYTPPQITTNSNYLVVEGLINTGTDSTIFKLSRTVRLNAKTTTQPETHAVVTVESDANTTYLLKEITPGTYASAALGLSKTAKYRLRIITNTNTHATYLSDFVPVKDSPPIDSIGYSLPANGLQIYANAHDATGNTRYYRWSYVETWNFHANFDAEYIETYNRWINLRIPAQGIFSCWTSNASTDVVLASSAKLTQDVIYQAPITIIPSPSQKISVKYSILVKQYALTLDAFNFWQLLKKNTEQLGSIFDAQPSSITGNIHNIADNTEPVLGYISAGAVQQKRIFVDNTALPIGWGRENPLPGCVIDSLYPIFPPSPPPPPGALTVTQIYYNAYLALTPNTPKPGDTTFWFASRPACADCTLKGTNKRPFFWPPI